jgi:hypothetical protein
MDESAEEYVGGVVEIEFTLLAYILLSLHPVTFVPERVRVDISAASNHTIQSGTDLGSKPEIDSDVSVDPGISIIVYCIYL